MKQRTKKWVAGIAGVLVFLGVGFFFLARYYQKRGTETLATYQQYEAVLQEFSKGQRTYETGNREEARAVFAKLRKTLEKAPRGKPWKELQKNIYWFEGALAFQDAMTRYNEYRDAYLKSPGKLPKTVPGADDILGPLKDFERAMDALRSSENNHPPEIAWRIENDRATGKVWQMIVRAALKEEKLKDLTPFYASALTGYQAAMRLAETARGHDTEYTDPVRIVSQNIDYMTRATEFLDQSSDDNKDKKSQDSEEQEPQKRSQEEENKKQEEKRKTGRSGLGDFLAMTEKKERQQAGAQSGQTPGKKPPSGMGKLLSDQPGKDNQKLKFLPMPQTAGSGRLQGARK